MVDPKDIRDSLSLGGAGITISDIFPNSFLDGLIDLSRVFLTYLKIGSFLGTLGFSGG